MNDKHIVQSYDADLSRIHGQVTAMGALVAEQFEKLIKAVCDQDAALAMTITQREVQVNALEVAADTEIFVVLAKRCPVASDLRLVMTASKIVTHLERIGDEVAKVANVLLNQFLKERLVGMAGSGDATIVAGRKTLSLLGRVMAAFDRLDFAEAGRLLQEERYPNSGLHDSMLRLMEAIESEPQPIHGAVGQILILKAVDRINDLVFEIAKDVIFLGETDARSDASAAAD